MQSPAADDFGLGRTPQCHCPACHGRLYRPVKRRPFAVGGPGYHVIIARDGRDTAKTIKADGSDPIVSFCTPFPNPAAHVGPNVPIKGGGGRIANRRSIGIALANRQSGKACTPKQIAVLSEIIEHVKSKLPTVTHLTTHAVIQPWNRFDPLAVDGKALALKHGLMWFQPTAVMIALSRRISRARSRL